MARSHLYPLFVVERFGNMSIKLKHKIERNASCPCGSGLKGKFCHGNSEKLQACNQIAQMYMMKLIREERKKRGLEPYDFTCKSCGKGTDKPVMSTLNTPTPVFKCPLCGSTDLENNKEHIKVNEEPEKKSSIILEA